MNKGYFNMQNPRQVVGKRVCISIAIIYHGLWLGGNHNGDHGCPVTRRKLGIEGVENVAFNWKRGQYDLTVSPLYDPEDVWLRLADMLDKRVALVKSWDLASGGRS